MLDDRDGDGVEEIALPARPPGCAVRIVSGQSLAVLAEMLVPSASELDEDDHDSCTLSHADVRDAGDLDGDGHGDLLLGLWDQGSAGQAWTFAGGNRAPLFGLSGVSDCWNHDVWGMGSAVAALGDVDGDGHDDVAIAQVSHGVGAKGALQILSGADGRRLARYWERDLDLFSAPSAELRAAALHGLRDLPGHDEHDPVRLLRAATQLAALGRGPVLVILRESAEERLEATAPLARALFVASDETPQPGSPRRTCRTIRCARSTRPSPTRSAGRRCARSSRTRSLAWSKLRMLARRQAYAALGGLLDDEVRAVLGFLPGELAQLEEERWSAIRAIAAGAAARGLRWDAAELRYVAD